jgi:hypothetical protein
MPCRGKHPRQSQRRLGAARHQDAVETIFQNLEAGMSVREITEVFDVTPEEVNAVVHFVTESLKKPTVPEEAPTGRG